MKLTSLHIKLGLLLEGSVLLQQQKYMEFFSKSMILKSSIWKMLWSLLGLLIFSSNSPISSWQRISKAREPLLYLPQLHTWPWAVCSRDFLGFMVLVFFQLKWWVKLIENNKINKKNLLFMWESHAASATNVHPCPAVGVFKTAEDGLSQT